MRWRELWLLISTAFRAAPWHFVASLPGPIVALAYPLLGFWLKFITDAVVAHDSSRSAVGVAGLLGTIVARWAVDYLCTAVQTTLAERVGFAFDDEILRLTAEIPTLDHWGRPDFRDRLELLRQAQGALGASLTALTHALSAIVCAAGTLVLLAMVHPLLLLLVVFALPAIPLATAQQRWRADAEECSAEPARLARHLRGLMVDPRAGMELRIFRWRADVQTRYRAAAADAARPLIRAQIRGALAGAAQDMLFTAAFIGTVGFVLWRAAHGHAEAGDVILAVVVCRQVQQAILWPVQSVAGLGEALRAAGRLLWLRAYASATRSTGRNAPARIRSGLDFEHVWFRYPGGERWILRDLSIHIPAGAVVALVGENGSGKSTIVNLLARFYEPTSGRILLDGVDLAELDPHNLRTRMSAAFQDFVRFELAAGHAVGIGELSRLADPIAVGSALERAGAADLPNGLPAGLATQLGARWPGGVDLSTGQWQKIALGRALIRADPLLLFLDEPTASLDAHTEHALFERYAAAARGRARSGAVTVLVSHRFSTVRSADVIVVLDDGRIIERGSHAELIKQGGRYAELYALQADSYK